MFLFNDFNFNRSNLIVIYVFYNLISFISSNSLLFFKFFMFIFIFITFIISIKSFIYFSLIAANIICVYYIGLIIISIYYFISLINYGLLILSYLLYLFISYYYSFLFILFYIELFSSFFNSITLINRLTINLFVGSLLFNLSSLLVWINIWGSSIIKSLLSLVILNIIFYYECLNSVFQSLIFILLSSFYLL